VIELPEQIIEQANLPGSAGRKIGMTAFGTMLNVARAMPGEERFAQASAGRDHPDGSAIDGLTRIDDRLVGRPQNRDGPCNRLLVVHEENRLRINIKFPRKRIRLDHPRQVGGFYLAAYNRAGDCERRPIDLTPLLAGEFFHDRLKAGVSGAVHFGSRHRRLQIRVVRENR
jgi:hypothetical protein